MLNFVRARKEGAERAVAITDTMEAADQPEGECAMVSQRISGVPRHPYPLKLGLKVPQPHSVLTIRRPPCLLFHAHQQEMLVSQSFTELTGKWSDQ